MSSVVAVCPVHGSVRSQGIVMDGVESVTLDGGTVPCPECGRDAALMQGTFNMRDGIIEVLSAPGWTREAILTVATTVKRAAQDLNSAAAGADVSAQISDLARQVSKQNEHLARLIEEQTLGKSKARVKWFLGTLFTVLLWCYNVDDVTNFSQDVLASIVDAVVSQSPAPGPAPAF